MLGQSISKNSVILGLFAAITAGVISITFKTTQTRIVEQEKKAASAALLALIPRSRHNNDMLSDVITLDAEQSLQLGFTSPTDVHVAKHDNELVAFVVPSLATDGYSGDIKMIIAINLDGTLAGARVLSHKETPGLGDKIDLRKSDWMLSFNGASLSNPAPSLWAVKKDGGEFDQFTGATITPRAVVSRIKNTLLLYQEQRDNWHQQAQLTPALNASIK